MLAAGTRLGPYEIVSPLGAGGMGEVYRARDTRLGRDVAVKVLPPALSPSPEVRARFEREAKTVSNLNHPNICTLFDVGREGETDYLVMELIEGETLAERLAKGPLPSADTLRLGSQIADALDRAHRAGVVHRDLKPGNVMLTKAGAKLMDFGLARATGLAGPAGGSGVTMHTLTTSPTVAQPLTAEGSIVGTFQYMSPEQLEGREADARSDLWALGCVLYEMATGRRAFEGKSQASLIAAILERQPPPPSQVSPMVPPALDRIIQQCLAKDPEERLQTAHDVKLQLQWVAEGGSQAGVPAPVSARRRGRERIAWMAAGALGVVALVLGTALALRRVPEPRVVRFDVRSPAGVTAISWPRLSPDGRMLAFLGTDSAGVRRVWIRPLDAIEAHPVAEMDGTSRPFWSPDSRFLAFISEGRLRKVPVAGGPAVAICDAPGGFDGSWGSDGWILFDGAADDSIRGVPASGGRLKPFTTIDHAHGDMEHGWPFFLPDGRHFLFVAIGKGSSGTIRLGTVGSTGTKVLGQTDGRVEYTAPGYLVYVNGGTLVAQPFDARAGKTTGDPVPVGEDVTLGGDSGDFSVSNSGVLAYRSQGAQERSLLEWVSRDGRVLGQAGPPGVYEDVALSPDGSRVAVTVATEQPAARDVWIRDIARGVSSRLTFDPTDDIWPVWSPDGMRVAYCDNRDGEFRTFVKPANGVGAEDSLAHVRGAATGPTDWSAAANVIMTSRFTTGGWDIWAQPADGKGTPHAVIQTPFSERSAKLSPDGRWMAYSSNESGRNEVYVVPFPGPGGKWQVSTAGGSYPQWRGDGKELYFQAPDETIMSVGVSTGASFEVGVPAALFHIPLRESQYSGYRWCPAKDGQRFLVNTPSGAIAAGRFVVASEWTSELKQR